MLFGTPNVRDLSFASINSTAENQRLKLSALICGLSAADNRCHSCAHCLSIAELLTVLHKCHTHWCVGNCSVKPRCNRAIARCDPRRECGKKRSKTCKYEGKRTNARFNISVGSTCRARARSLVCVGRGARAAESWSGLRGPRRPQHQTTSSLS